MKEKLKRLAGLLLGTGAVRGGTVRTARVRTSSVALALAVFGAGSAAADELGAVQLWEGGPYFATCNVGATKPQEYGYYFWWGDTVGYRHDGSKWVSVDGKDTSIKFNNTSPANTLYGKDSAALADYVDANGNLKPAYDAATAHLGAPWRMMTTDELNKLTSTDYCQRQWVTEYKGVSVNGYVVKGKEGTAYENNEVFFPAAGYGDGSSLDTASPCGYCWSSTPSSGSSNGASYLRFHSSMFDVSRTLRYYGQSVRAVRDTPPEPPVPEASAESAAGSFDFKTGFRIAKDAETLVVDPAWGEGVTKAEVKVNDVAFKSYAKATVDTWDTASLEPKRYELALNGMGPDDKTGNLNESAVFWKVGADWVVLDHENITTGYTFKCGTTYFVAGTNTVMHGSFNVEKNAKFVYADETSGFKVDGSGEDIPKMYAVVGERLEFFQMIEKIKGCEDNPWVVGTDGATPYPLEVTAWTNGTTLVVEGMGTAQTTAEILDEIKGGIQAITIVDATVTNIVSDALSGIGTDANKVALTLPDGWQGELPDEAGSWYGAKVTLTSIPFAVKNIRAKQRWPWEGKVRFSFDLTGAGTVQAAVQLMTNDVKVCDATTLDGETTFDLGEGATTNVTLVWNAPSDLAAAGLSGFNSPDAEIKVTAKQVPPPEPKYVQLWKDGPYFAKCNVGAAEPQEAGYYFWWGDTVGYTNNGSAWISVDGKGSKIEFGDITPANTTCTSPEDTEAVLAYCDANGNLKPEYDAATAHLGSPWRMPTQAELIALTNKTTMVWTKDWNNTGVNGMIVTGNTIGYTDKSIFLPVTGEAKDSGLISTTRGNYRSSTPNAQTSNGSYRLSFTSSKVSVDSYKRNGGVPVRPVRDTAE